MVLETHLHINTDVCGKVTKLETGYAEVLLHTTQSMTVDVQGLIHGGFVFGAADFAAMAAVNDPNVVLGAATSRFIAPVKLKDVVVFTAKVSTSKGKKKVVNVQAFVSTNLVFEGSFTTFVLERHILEAKS